MLEADRWKFGLSQAWKQFRARQPELKIRWGSWCQVLLKLRPIPDDI